MTQQNAIPQDPPLFLYPRDPDGRMLIPVSDINFENRLRADLGDVQGLADDIKLNGLIQPVIISRDMKLIAGGRRSTAMIKVLGMTSIPCVFKETLSETHLRVMEISENTKRKDLDWREQALGIAEVHRLMHQEKAIAFQSWNRSATADLLSVSKASVNNAIWLSECIIAGDKEVIDSVSAKDALRVLLKRREDALTKSVSQATLPPKASKKSPTAASSVESKTPGVLDFLDEEDTGFSKRSPKDFSQLEVAESLDEEPGAAGDVESDEQVVPLSLMLHNADCVDWALSQSPGFCDHIITDIPYGINMDNLADYKNIDDVRAEHDVEENVQLYHRMFPALWHALKDKGFVVMWYDLDHHNLLQGLAESVGFSVQRWPLIWHKTHPCKNGSPNVNWCKNYEHAMVLRKGSPNLIKPQTTSVFACGAEREMRMLGHPFAKPTALWKWIYSAVSIIGQVVWDPFMGVGSSTLAAIEQGLKPIGCEVKETHYHKAVFNVSEKYRSALGKVRFE